MALISVQIECPLHMDQGDVEAFSELLLELGARAVSIEDANRGSKDESPIFREPEYDPATSKWRDLVQPYWDKCKIIALFPAGFDFQETLMFISAELQLASFPIIETSKVRDIDWVEAVKETFKPIRVKDIWITFPWNSIDHPEMINVKLEPGLAFGTGEHKTTQLCGEWMQDIDMKGKTVLDYGSGSGILSIMAKKLGAASVTGVEIDSYAISAAKANVRLNPDVSDGIEFFENKNEPNRRYEVIIANILAPILIDLAPLLSKRGSEGSLLALAGIVTSQAQMVTDAFEKHGFQMEEARVKDDWTLLIGRKRPTNLT